MTDTECYISDNCSVPRYWCQRLKFEAAQSPVSVLLLLEPSTATTYHILVDEKDTNKKRKRL